MAVLLFCSPFCVEVSARVGDKANQEGKREGRSTIAGVKAGSEEFLIRRRRRRPRKNAIFGGALPRKIFFSRVCLAVQKRKKQVDQNSKQVCIDDGVTVAESFSSVVCFPF